MYQHIFVGVDFLFLSAKLLVEYICLLSDNYLLNHKSVSVYIFERKFHWNECIKLRSCKLTGECHVSGDSQLSMKMMRGEVSAKTTYQRTANGPVSIAEANPEGKFILLENNPSGGVRKVNTAALLLFFQTSFQNCSFFFLALKLSIF